MLKASEYSSLTKKRPQTALARLKSPVANATAVKWSERGNGHLDVVMRLRCMKQGVLSP